MVAGGDISHTTVYLSVCLSVLFHLSPNLPVFALKLLLGLFHILVRAFFFPHMTHFTVYKETLPVALGFFKMTYSIAHRQVI